MRPDVKRIIINLGILLLATLILQGYAQAQKDEKLFQEAKILIFDKKWEMAQEKLEVLLEKYPQSLWFSQAVFYRAKCLEEQDGKKLDALNAYMGYTGRKDAIGGLIEESEISIINLAYALYEQGKKSYLSEIEKRLSSSNKRIRYYAAFQLSYVKEKKVADKGIPVLKEIIEKEDEELKDRAKIALLRIAPDSLRDFEEERYERKAKILSIRIYKEGARTPEVKINIPWALADLALSSISESDRDLMKKKGYDLDRIIKELTEYKGNIIEIKGEDGTVIKIWID